MVLHELFIPTVPEIVSKAIFGLLWLAAGYRTLLRALKNIAAGNLFDENFLMSLATICALVIDAWAEAAGVMVFYAIGEAVENATTERANRSIQALLAIRPDTARVVKNGAESVVDAAEVQPGDSLVLLPGERVPVDAVLVSPAAVLDASSLTGESVPLEVAAGAELASGLVNLHYRLELRALRPASASTAARILDLIQGALARKSKTERFISRFARWYTPIVVLLAVLVAVLPPLLTGQALSGWLYRAMVLLVVSCPCALVISIPLGYAGGIGAASRAGILVKGSVVLDRGAKVDSVVFDKTGTLTSGSFAVMEVQAAAGFGVESLQQYAGALARGSTHPVSRALAAWAPAGDTQASEITELPGRGVQGKVRGQTVLIERNPNGNPAHTSVRIMVDGRLAGQVDLADQLRQGSVNAVTELRTVGIDDIHLFTGDHQGPANRVAELTGISKVRHSQLPEQKLQGVQELSRQGRKVLFVGDGLNDAPVIAASELGVAMGGLGSQAAAESADALLVHDEPRMVPRLIRIARKTSAIVKQNIVLALFIKLAVMGMGTAGLAGMWEAVFADVGVTLLAVLNASRAMKA